LAILQKNIERFQKRKVLDYPRFFIVSASPKLESTVLKKLFKKVVSLFIIFLIKIKILKRYSDEYGLLCTIWNNKSYA